MNIILSNLTGLNMIFYFNEIKQCRMCGGRVLYLRGWPVSNLTRDTSCVTDRISPASSSTFKVRDSMRPVDMFNVITTSTESLDCDMKAKLLKVNYKFVSYILLQYFTNTYMIMAGAPLSC